MKNKWSTLIELIAVIIIVGIVVLVAIPAVTSVMRGAKKSSLEQTGSQLVKSADIYYTSCLVNNGYTLFGDKCLSDLKNESENSGKDLKDVLGVKGDIPKGLLAFLYSRDGQAMLLFKDSGFVCSNMVDVNDNPVYYNDNGNKAGTKFTCIREEEVKLPERNPNITIVSGDGTKVGDEVCIGEECFYVIGATEEDVELLAKYNIFVGSIYSNEDELVSSITSSEQGYGLQSESAKGLINDYDNRVGTVFFSVSTFDEEDKYYWLNDDYSLSKDYEPSNSDYPYVFDEYNNIYKYVNNYVKKLATDYNIIASGNLISYEKLISLGCTKDGNCINAPSYVTSTTYWTGSASKVNDSYTNVWTVSNEKKEIITHKKYFPYNETFAGVRPVITISKSSY